MAKQGPVNFEFKSGPHYLSVNDDGVGLVTLLTAKVIVTSYLMRGGGTVEWKDAGTAISGVLLTGAHNASDPINGVLRVATSLQIEAGGTIDGHLTYFILP